MDPVKLSPDKVANLIQAQRDLHDVLPELDKAEQCGIDCREWRALHADASDKIQKLLDNYS